MSATGKSLNELLNGYGNHVIATFIHTDPRIATEALVRERLYDHEELVRYILAERLIPKSLSKLTKRRRVLPFPKERSHYAVQLVTKGSGVVYDKALFDAGEDEAISHAREVLRESWDVVFNNSGRYGHDPDAFELRISRL